MNVTRPTGLDFTDWASQVCMDLEGSGLLGRPDTFPNWQDWAAQLLNNTTLGRNLPNPYTFTAWNEWAERLCGALA